MSISSRLRSRGLLWLVIALPCGAWSCGSPPTRADLRSGNALDRARGVVAVTEARDSVAVHKLVDMLDDPDRGVRMYAILALVRLCGEDYGYRYYESAARRAPAVERWREALRSGEIVLRTPGGPGASNEPPDLASRGAEAEMGGAAP